MVLYNLVMQTVLGMGMGMNVTAQVLEQLLASPADIAKIRTLEASEGGMMRLETLIELKFVSSSFSSSNL